eukprot:TRINITY_DN6671_c0_g1_i1.p1 TRINITY_DN6671_c0_g1~~TRINITY_DN6671_c0_g1_i1.p1  ORF type:complete len:457 (+),score=181.64 TRINITY_DN6671_c0_g1_i1:89-1372(+)
MCIRDRFSFLHIFFFFQAEDGIRDHAQSRGLGDVYKRQILFSSYFFFFSSRRRHTRQESVSWARRCVQETDSLFFIFFFFFKQKTAYEIMPSLVGSEMCIRDSINAEYMGIHVQTRTSKGVTYIKTKQISQNSRMSSQVPQVNSLVKYATPVLVSTSSKKKDGKKDTKGNQTLRDIISTTHTEDILNSILPPREHTLDKQQLWIQSVLSTPATKADVLALQEELDKRLQTRQARETGICPIREELYAQCFDELIRQITINCSERGLLLVRVRDEIRMTITAYQTLYESSIAFGMRKALQAEQKKAEMQAKIKTLESECQNLQREVENLEIKIEEIERNERDQQEKDEKTHKEEVDFLKRTNQRYKEELEKLLSGNKKQMTKPLHVFDLGKREKSPLNSVIFFLFFCCCCLFCTRAYCPSFDTFAFDY